MWLFLPYGFFSVVVDALAQPPGLLLVRARVKKDLTALVKNARDIGALGSRRTPILYTPKNDYPYRVRLTRGELDAVLGNFIQHELDYPNFKAAAGRAMAEAGRDVQRREHVLHKVWATARELEFEDGPKPGRLVLPSDA